MAKRKEKLKDFRKMSEKELAKAIDDKREKLRQLRFDLVAGKVKNIREVEETKKDIARLLTIMKD